MSLSREVGACPRTPDDDIRDEARAAASDRDRLDRRGVAASPRERSISEKKWAKAKAQRAEERR